MPEAKTGRVCVYCKLPVATMQHSKNRWCCRPCNRDTHYYHVWRRKIEVGGVGVAELEVANLQRRIKLLQQAARGVLLGEHVHWVAGKSTQGRHPNGVPRIERDPNPSRPNASRKRKQ